MPSIPFLEFLSENVAVFDGGMGTMLYEKGVFINHCFDELNLSAPALVQAVHAAYQRAGADVVETNTFGANAVKLEAHGARARLRDINLRGARLAREAVGQSTYVAGSVGPLGIKIEPWGPTSVDEARALFREQAEALLEGGVDLFVLETFSDINEIGQAIQAVRELDAHIPVVAQMTLGEDGNSLYGTAPEVFAQRLVRWGADLVGVNCSVGPAGMLDALERMSRVVTRPLSVQPNAGLPRLVDGRNMYLASPEYMASYARRFLSAGALAIGGCCGTTPEHIRAIHQAVEEGPRARRRGAASAVIEGGLDANGSRSPAATAPREERSRLASRLAKGEFVVAAQLAPPRGLEARDALEGTRELALHGITIVNVPEAVGASARMPSEALAVLLERETGVETIFHSTCRDRTLLGLQSALLGAHALGLRNVLCETGDAALLGRGTSPAASFEVDSIGLTNMVRRLNQGFDLGGSPIGAPTSWHIGVQVNPTALDLEAELGRYRWKVDAGAEFCVTQPVFDAAALRTFLERIADPPIPVLVSLVPLTSRKLAETFANEVPGSRVPVELLERIRTAAARSPEAALAEGVAGAREILAEVHDRVQGVIVATPGPGVGSVLEVVKAVLG